METFLVVEPPRGVLPGLRIPLYEIDFTYVRSSGPGGQNVNKVNSKAVLRWAAKDSPSLPLGVRARLLERHASRLTETGDLVITSDRFRDQGRNAADCLEKLRQLLLEIAHPPKPRKATKPTKGSKRRRVEGKKLQSAKKANRSGRFD
jgi:ribosome-associated protein